MADQDNSNTIKQDNVRILRVLEYSGPRAAVEEAVRRSVTGFKSWHQSMPNEYGRYDASMPTFGTVKLWAVTVTACPEPTAELTHQFVAPSNLANPPGMPTEDLHLSVHPTATALELADMQIRVNRWIQERIDKVTRQTGGEK